MNCYIQYIALLDKKSNKHFVKLAPGVNVITGKSSTGKSAMIEIFDYCFGSEDPTIPEGIITENAKLYFIVLVINNSSLILARKPNSDRGYIKESGILNSLDSIDEAYFSNIDELRIEDFKKELNKFFQLNIVDTDEDQQAKEARGRKLPAPSIRSFTSFILQHQNLIANKHSLFYRFDEKEKREQVINHFKIFVGFVDQEYFIKSQRINNLKNELKSLNLEVEKNQRYNESLASKLDILLKEFQSIVGISLANQRSNELLKTPKKSLEIIASLKINPNADSEEYTIRRNEIIEKQNELILQLRRKQIELTEVTSSINYAKKYLEKSDAIHVIDQVELHASNCPFCNNDNNEIIQSANRLEEAINWLNQELIKTPYQLESFKSDEEKIQTEIKQLKIGAKMLKSDLDQIDKTIEELGNNISLETQGLKLKYRIESLLEETIEFNPSELESTIKSKEKEIQDLEKELVLLYNVKNQEIGAENIINKRINSIGNGFDFESYYQPINLKFDLEKFELYHSKPGKKIYLRSMGSGANWLYCHLSLFLGLQYYFCSLGNKCKIPPILFLDQPSQVYFPSEVDNQTSFNPQELKKMKDEENYKKESVDEDLRSVTKMYNQMVKHCNDTLKETGIMPQIILTDHADNLDLEDDIKFEDLVAGRRWRTRGFIDNSKPQLTA